MPGVRGLAACDSSKTAPSQHTRQVTVVGTGQVQGTPDTLTAAVSIEFSAPDVTTATAEPVPLEPGQQTVAFSVTAVWQLS